jgi:hypothetical protein
MTEDAHNPRAVWSSFASDEFDRAITARHVMTPMALATALTEDTLASDGVTLLRRFGYDQAPVGGGVNLRGYVLLRDLEDRTELLVADLLHPLEPRLLVGLEATIETLLSALDGVEMLFVVGSHEVAGFVTPSDFGRPAVRLHFYLHIADLEMTLADLVRSRFGDGRSALSLLASARQVLVLERHAAAQRLAVELDYVSDLELSDLLTIVGGSPELRVVFGASSRRGWQKRVGRLVDLRNYVMHPTKTDLPRWSNVGELAAAEATIRGLLAQAAGARQAWLTRPPT